MGSRFTAGVLSHASPKRGHPNSDAGSSSGSTQSTDARVSQDEVGVLDGLCPPSPLAVVYRCLDPLNHHAAARLIIRPLPRRSQLSFVVSTL